MTKTQRDYQIHAFSYYLGSMVDPRGVMWIYETGRLPFDLEIEIDKTLGGSYWYKELAYHFSSGSYRSGINPKTKNLEEIEAAAKNLSDYIKEKAPLYR